MEHCSAEILRRCSDRQLVVFQDPVWRQRSARYVATGSNEGTQDDDGELRTCVEDLNPASGFPGLKLDPS